MEVTLALLAALPSLVGSGLTHIENSWVDIVQIDIAWGSVYDTNNFYASLIKGLELFYVYQI